ncbi:nitroreductase family deazaflavin-dependent oxidoreductase [Flexivirga lutea]
MVSRLLSAPETEVADGEHELRVLCTKGRRTGAEHLTPVGVLHLAGRLFLVCPDRRRDWPRNLGADGRCSLRSGAGEQRCEAREVTGDVAADVVAAYLSAVQVPWAVRAFGLGPSPDRASIVSALPRFAVFRLDDVEAGKGMR